jgi:two-component system, LytTR family, response regulator
MIKVAIIDDEKHCILTLQHHLKNIHDIDIVAVTQDSTEAKNLIERSTPDLVFMDIDMPQLTGFQVMEQFENPNFQVVFVTAYDQYAIKAIKINALDYLLKPVDKHDIEALMTRFRQKELFTSSRQISQLNQSLQGKISDTLALSTQEGLIFIKIEDIMYLEADSCYTSVVMNDATKHLVSKTMATFEEVLQSNPLFFRAHKSFIINLKYIKQYLRGEGGDIIMKDNRSIVLSRNKKQEFLNFFQKI